jgi:O-antigen/teichoic acid export membrane protein
LLVSATMLFCAVIALAGESIMTALYQNREYEGQGATVTALALAVLHYAAGFPAANGLMTMQRPQAIVWASILGAIVTVSLVLPLFHMNGLLGAALAVLAGSAVEAAVRWAAFLINAFSSTQTVGRQAKARAISNPATGTIIAEGVGMDV